MPPAEMSMSLSDFKILALTQQRNEQADLVVRVTADAKMMLAQKDAIIAALQTQILQLEKAVKVEDAAPV